MAVTSTVAVGNRLAAISLVILLASTSVAPAQDYPQLRGPTEGKGALRLEAPEYDKAPKRSRKFNGSGTLYRVKSNESGAERYALMDNEGSILAFLAPSSRHDLQSFVGQSIGIKARTFGNNDDVAPYVIVERVSLQQDVIVDSAVQTAGHEQVIEPVVVDSGQPAWRMASNESSPAGRVASRPHGSGCATCGDPSHVTANHGAPVYGEPVYHEPMYNGPSYEGSGFGGPGYGSSGPIYDGGYADSSCGLGGCTTSTSCTTCGTGMPCCCPKPCGPPGWLYLRGEYLLWFTDGMDLPPLVTGSDTGTLAGQAGVLGESSTETLFGDDDILSEGRSGFRILFGGFFGPSKKLGWEAEYFDIGDIDEKFEASGDGSGNPIIARPFFNTRLNAEDAEIVSFPNTLTGTVSVDAFSRFNGAAGRFRLNKCCKRKNPVRSCGGCGPCGGCGQCGYPPYCMIDFTAGYRHYSLREGLRIEEDLTSLQPDNAGRFELFDNFETRNDFHGGEIGTSYRKGRNRWTWEMLMRTAIGSTRQRVAINGETTISPLVSPATTFDGGLLAQRSNSGVFERNRFSMIPELGTTLGFYVSPRMRVTVGYSLIYWSNVVRPGDQIDLDLNTDLIPPESEPVVGALRPRFAFQETDFWAQGLNLGLDYRW